MKSLPFLERKKDESATTQGLQTTERDVKKREKILKRDKVSDERKREKRKKKKTGRRS